MRTPARLDLRSLNRATLARQLLLARARAPALDAIEQLAGLQAQLARPPFVALWSRLQGFSRDELAALVQGRKAVRAPFFRHTIHLVSARDFLAFRGVVQGALERAAVTHMKKVKDPDAVLRTARALLAEPLTYGALRDGLVKKHPRGDPMSLAFVPRTRLPLVQLPGEGPWSYPANAELATAEAWLGRPPAADGERAREALAVRYLAAFGPATAADVREWSGVPEWKAVLERLRERLVAVEGPDGKELLDLPDAPRPGGDVPAPVRFLPDFDNLLLGHADRTRVMPPSARPAFAAKNGMVPGAVLVDGFVGATWRAEVKGGRIAVAVTPLGKLTRAERAEVEAEGDALAAFLEPAAKAREVMVGKA